MGVGRTGEETPAAGEDPVSPSGGQAPAVGGSGVAPDPESGDDRLVAAVTAMGFLAAELTVRGRLRRAAELIPPFLDARWGAVAVRAPDGSVQEWVLSTSDPDEARLVHEVLEEHEARTEGEAGARVASVPVKGTLGVYADLFVVKPPGARFTAGQRAMLAAFVATAAVGVDNAAQYEETRQRLAWLKASADIGQQLLRSGQDEREVWQQIADTVHALAGARTVTLALPSEDSDDDFEIRVAAGLGAEELVGRTYPLAGSLTEQVLQTGAVQLTRSTRYRISHTYVAPEVPVGYVMALPLQGQGQPRGAILVSRAAGQPPFSLIDLRLAQDFANQAAIALELVETRAAQQRLEMREDVERITDTFQDQVIQRLFSIGLRLEVAANQHQDGEVPPWLSEVVADVGATITEARASLATGYQRPSGS
jgi:GAF domain-containing protein